MTYLSTVFEDGVKSGVRDRDIWAAIKKAAAMLDYPSSRGIPIDRIDTHSLHIGGANALSLAGLPFALHSGAQLIRGMDEFTYYIFFFILHQNYACQTQTQATNNVHTSSADTQ